MKGQKMFRTNAPLSIVLLAQLMRVSWNRNTMRWLQRRYVANATHAAQFLRLLHGYKEQGWSYSREVRDWAEIQLLKIARDPSRAHYMFGRVPFHNPNRGRVQYLLAVYDFTWAPALWTQRLQYELDENRIDWTDVERHRLEECLRFRHEAA